MMALPEVYRTYTERTWRVIEAAAPPHPPCWPSQAKWVEWLAIAHIACETGCRPLIGNKMNSDLDYCIDCEPSGKAQFAAAGRCRPLWLKQAEWEAKP